MGLFFLVFGVVTAEEDPPEEGLEVEEFLVSDVRRWWGERGPHRLPCDFIFDLNYNRRHNIQIN